MGGTSLGRAVLHHRHRQSREEEGREGGLRTFSGLLFSHCTCIPPPPAGQKETPSSFIQDLTVCSRSFPRVSVV